MIIKLSISLQKPIFVWMANEKKKKKFYPQYISPEYIYATI